MMKVRIFILSLSIAALAMFGAATAQDDGDWATEWSDMVNVHLLADLDSSGPPAWDPEEHPDVFITTEGMGYSGLMGSPNSPGLAIIDANTYEPVASQSYELEGADEYFEPHGLGVSSDGRWIYLPTGTSPGFGAVGTGRLLIIDAYTLKIDKILSTPTNPHHAKSFTHADGRELVLAYTFREGGFYILDPNDDNRMVGSVPNRELQGNGYLAFTTPDGEYLLISTRPPSGVDAHGFVSVIDTETWELVRNIEVLDSDPIWIAITADGNEALVTGGHDSNLTRLSLEGDVSDWHVDGAANAAALGPYGVHYNWDEDRAFVVSKGEATHNRGITLGEVNPVIMQPPPLHSWAPGPVATHHTACIRGDHGTVHPDIDRDELWITCNGSFEIVVFDMFAKEVKERIPMPNGGSTHSGAFVHYEADPMASTEGTVLSDQNGMHGPALQTKREILGLE
ncbi:MAG: hypothetical protein U5K81_02895 [Trueperaceae bacterium]|nr:hypothetical protein [Trueperaceae bacterium]